MATTSPELATMVIDTVARTGTAYAFLHGEAEAATGIVSSDVDLVVGGGVDAVVRDLTQRLPSIGLHPIVWLPYDIDAGGLFIATESGDDGIQLDLSADTEGRGKYGFRSGPVLERAVRGNRWYRLDPLDEQLYLLRKRQFKHDAARLGEAVANCHALGAATAVARAREVFSPCVAAEIAAAIDTGGADSTHRRVTPAGWRAATLTRWARRVARPAGAWVEGTEEQAVDLAARFGRFLVAAQAHRRSPATSTVMASLRWRGGLIATHPPTSSRLLKADLQLAPGLAADEAARHVVQWLLHRLAQRLH